MYWGPSRQNSSIKTSFTSPQSEPKKIKTSFNITHEMYEKNIITSISTSTHLSFHAGCSQSQFHLSLSHTPPICSSFCMRICRRVDIFGELCSHNRIGRMSERAQAKILVWSHRL